VPAGAGARAEAAAPPLHCAQCRRLLPRGDRSCPCGGRACALCAARGAWGRAPLTVTGRHCVRRLAETVWLVRTDGGFEKKSPWG